MNTILRNFFYAVGSTILFALHGLDAGNAQFADLVRLAQSPMALNMVLALTMLFLGLDVALGTAGGRRASVGACSGCASGERRLDDGAAARSSGD